MYKLFILLAFSLLLMEGNAQIRVEGLVSDPEGTPIPGVTVVAGRSSSISDSTGHFSLLVSDSSLKISFTHIGYQQIIKNINGRSRLHIAMEPVVSLMKEAMVYAYGLRYQPFLLSTTTSTISKTVLEHTDGISLVQAMNTVAGVKMDQRSPGSYRLSIRGNLLRSTFGVRNTKIYYDGIPYTDASGNSYLNALSPSSIGSMEIIKGPAGSMYGSGTGGVLLLSSPYDSLTRASIAMSAGRYHTYNLGAAVNLGSSESITTLGIDRQSGDGYREQSAMNRTLFRISTKQKLTDRNYFKGNFIFSRLNYQTPGGLTKQQMEADPTQARPASGIFPSAVQQQAAIALQVVYASASLYSSMGNGFSNQTGISVDAFRLKNPAIRNYEIKNEQGVNARTVFTYRHSFFQADLGSEYQYYFNNNSTFGNRMGVADTLQYQDEIGIAQFNLFLQMRYQVFRDLVFETGISYNNFTYRYHRLGSSDFLPDDKLFPAQWIPRVGMNLKLSSTVHWYAQVSKGYSPPSLDEIHSSDGVFNKELNAEQAWNYETGFSAQLENWGFNINGYRSLLTNTIVTRYDSSGAEYYVNAGKTGQTGIEASVSYNHAFTGTVLQKISASGAYTFQRARFIHYTQGSDKYDGNKLTGVAPHLASIWVEADFVKGFYTRLSYQYTDQIPLNDANRFYGSAYHLMDFWLGFRWGIHKLSGELFAAYNCSLNNPYSLGNDLNAAGNRFFNPSAPAYWQLGLKFYLQK